MKKAAAIALRAITGGIAVALRWSLEPPPRSIVGMTGPIQRTPLSLADKMPLPAIRRK
jgi:hypothetical protein